VSDDRRAVLEAIVYGSDSSIRPGERLRALELLDELDGRQPPWTPTGELDADLLKPRALAALVPVSNRLLRDADDNPSAELIVRNDLADHPCHAHAFGPGA